MLCSARSSMVRTGSLPSAIGPPRVDATSPGRDSAAFSPAPIAMIAHCPESTPEGGLPASASLAGFTDLR